jgi:hypothetical protein
MKGQTTGQLGARLGVENGVCDAREVLYPFRIRKLPHGELSSHKRPISGRQKKTNR